MILQQFIKLNYNLLQVFLVINLYKDIIEDQNCFIIYYVENKFRSTVRLLTPLTSIISKLVYLNIK